MDHVTSDDGTSIAFDTIGEGTPVVIVGGALSTAAAARPLALALADVGLQGVVMDRRARGESADAAAYTPEREAEDVAAVVGATGAAAVLGHSSGAVLALFAAARGVTAQLFLSEPPFLFGEGLPDPHLPERLQSLVDDERGGDAVVTFQREAVGLPEPVIEQIRTSPAFASLVPLAQSVVYDAALTRALSTPTPAMLDVPATILRGEPTFPALVRACELLHAAMRESELVIVPESRDHGMDPAGTARELRARIR
ncbi:alpha/beta hydrolase [Microbacterium nanhaiense]|uniref:Alpha/beta hydrolase n=1 Tax=Microbacterium nanhaiense TaxID=1301026 RepID=A0ABQ2N1P4_9MICO|nr:alpha/beta fold hydrolase [Microbacterium nanhaiense]GGO65230.1 alpha/beta hydrolase [Microbacterium nanhaiense]